MGAGAAALNALWAETLIAELVRLGVRDFAVSPGSRSTPLTLAAARTPGARPTLHLDERGAAFWALGAARGSGRPAAAICTSGTAAANWLPAAVEASMDGVALILLTADRPAELVDCGANQTIVQPDLFGAYVRWRADLPPPDPAFPIQALLTAADQAVHRATGAPPGPVHLNLPFREPLAGEPPAPLPDHPALTRWRAGSAPFTAALPRPAPAPLPADHPALAALAGARRGIVVAGRAARPSESAAMAAVAARLGWPVLPDVASGLRLGPCAAARTTGHDLFLRDPALRARLAPDAVLHLGGESVSKPLARFLAEAAPPIFLRVHEDPRRRDPGHALTARLDLSAEALAAALDGWSPPPPDPGWRARWAAADAAVGATLAGMLDDPAAPLDEPAVARLLPGLLPADWALFLGSSMPIRDVDAFAPADGPALRVAANRGASGIDGALACACGFARGAGRPVALLCGDLTLLHDLNALALLRAADPPVVAVVLNNDGGGIFHFLPVADEPDFEPWFGTPHGLRFEGVCRDFGVDRHAPRDRAGFAAALAAACAGGRPALIEVATERVANRRRHREIEAAALAALRAAAPA